MNSNQENIDLVIGLFMLLGAFLMFMGIFETIDLFVYLFNDSPVCK